MPARDVRKVGAYAKLLANYAADDAIMEAGEAAELLFVRALAFCSTSDSDGFISDQQVVRYVGAGMRDAKKRADRLVAVGVWQRMDGGYQVRSWTKIHDTAEEKGRRLRADRERKRQERGQEAGVPSPVRPDSERSPSGQTQDNVPDSLSLIHNRTGQDRGNTGQDTDSESAPTQTARKLAASFVEFWTAYPRKTAKGDAEKAWPRAAKLLPPDDLVAAARKFAGQQRGADPKFIPHPATWLNQKRWEDEPATRTGTDEGMPW